MSRLTAWLRRKAAPEGAAPLEPLAPDSALAHIEHAHTTVAKARTATGRWLVGDIHLDAEAAHDLADRALEAAEHLRSFAALLPGEVDAAARLRGIDPDDLTGGA